MPWQLHQFTLCPFSRKVRILLAEKGVGYALVNERPWERRDAFIDLNPVGQTPVMVDERGTVLIDSCAISEYFEETVERSSVLNGSAAARAEIRRLVTLFDQHFYQDVTAPLLHEKVIKRLVTREPPSTQALREAMKAAVRHLDYVDYLLGHHNWIAGTTFGLADIAMAAQISIADYLGGIDWRGHDETAHWYRGFKSRPSLRQLLSERMDGISPPAQYEDPDF